MTTAILGTQTGVYSLDGSRATCLGLESERISAVYGIWENGTLTRVLAGSYESGLFLSDDVGGTWSEVTDGFTALCVRWLGEDPLNPGSLLAGTEPARIFRSRDGGESWQELEGIRDIEGHDEWYLPYSPRAGAVRNVYSPRGSGIYLASVEVGGLLESRDGGETWSCRHVGVDSDIHYITGHPERGEVLYAALGYAGIDHTPNQAGPGWRGGVARSTDGGSSWTKLLTDYTRGVIVPESRTEIVVAGPSPDVGRNGRIEVSHDGGDSWEDASSGIATPMEDMVEVFVEAPDDEIWAVCSGGRLLRSSVNELHWTPVLQDANQLEVESVSFGAGG